MKFINKFPEFSVFTVPMVSFVMGLVLAYVGKLIGGDWQVIMPLLPFMFTLIYGNVAVEFIGYVFYGIGISVVYVNEIVIFTLAL